MWDVWLDLEEEFEERRPFLPFLELFGDNESKKLLAPSLIAYPATHPNRITSKRTSRKSWSGQWK